MEIMVLEWLMIDTGSCSSEVQFKDNFLIPKNSLTNSAFDN